MPARPWRATCRTPRRGLLRGGSLQNSLQCSLLWAPERRLHPCLVSFRCRSPPPLSQCVCTGRAGECCPSAALLRIGAGMPNVPPGAAVPHPSSHRGTRGALSVSVCRTNLEAWQPGVLLRAPGLGTALRLVCWCVSVSKHDAHWCTVLVCFAQHRGEKIRSILLLRLTKLLGSYVASSIVPMIEA